MLFLEKNHTHTQNLFFVRGRERKPPEFHCGKVGTFIDSNLLHIHNSASGFYNHLPATATLLNKSLSGTKVLVSVEMVNSKPSQQQH